MTEIKRANWKVQCKMSLIKDGLDGSETIPEVNNINGAYSEFIFPKYPTDPTSVWEKPSTQLQKKTWASKRHLHSLQLKEGHCESTH